MPISRRRRPSQKRETLALGRGLFGGGFVGDGDGKIVANQNTLQAGDGFGVFGDGFGLFVRFFLQAGNGLGVSVHFYVQFPDFHTHDAEQKEDAGDDDGKNDLGFVGLGFIGHSFGILTRDRGHEKTPAFLAGVFFGFGTPREARRRGRVGGRLLGFWFWRNRLWLGRGPRACRREWRGCPRSTSRREQWLRLSPLGQW